MKDEGGGVGYRCAHHFIQTRSASEEPRPDDIRFALFQNKNSRKDAKTQRAVFVFFAALRLCVRSGNHRMARLVQGATILNCRLRKKGQPRIDTNATNQKRRNDHQDTKTPGHQEELNR